MSIQPIITFKAGICDLDAATNRAKPRETPGYIYLYAEEDLIHFCWRPRSAPLHEPELDLIMFPTDGSFTPYQKSTIRGRIWVLKFSSSSQRELFWMQSKSQASNGDPRHFSARDLKLGEIVDSLLQGEEVDVRQEMAQLRAEDDDHEDADEDETMEDVEGTNRDREHRGGAGAGANATGGDYRAEGEGSREGGADGGRAGGTSSTLDAQSIIRNFIQSMGGTTPSQSVQQTQFTTLQDLLTTSATISWIDTISERRVDQLLEYLPSSLTALAKDSDDELEFTQPLSFAEKKDLLRRVLRSPQFSQSLASLTIALRDGGLPSVSEALNIPVQNGGYVRRGGVPLGGGDAVKAFMDGVRELAKDETMDDKDTTP